MFWLTEYLGDHSQELEYFPANSTFIKMHYFLKYIRIDTHSTALLNLGMIFTSRRGAESESFNLLHLFISYFYSAMPTLQILLFETLSEGVLYVLAVCKKIPIQAIAWMGNLN